MIFLGDFAFVKIFLKNYRVTMTTTLELHVRKIQWFCQQGEGFCIYSMIMAAGHTFSFKLLKIFIILALLDCKTYSTRPYIVPTLTQRISID